MRAIAGSHRVLHSSGARRRRVAYSRAPSRPRASLTTAIRGKVRSSLLKRLSVQRKLSKSPFLLMRSISCAPPTGSSPQAHALAALAASKQMHITDEQIY